MLNRCRCRGEKTGRQKENGNSHVISDKILRMGSMTSNSEYHKSMRNYLRTRCGVVTINNSTDCRLVGRVLGVIT